MCGMMHCWVLAMPELAGESRTAGQDRAIFRKSPTKCGGGVAFDCRMKSRGRAATAGVTAKIFADMAKAALTTFPNHRARRFQSLKRGCRLKLVNGPLTADRLRWVEV